MVLIETERLILQEYKTSDWQAAHVYCQQAEILKYEAWGPNTKEQTQEFIQQAIAFSKEEPRRTFELCIVLKEKAVLIGGCGFRIHAENSKRGDFGYIVNPIYWNQGYATEASKGLLNYMIQQHQITEIEATCDVLNIASRKVLEKCGLRQVRELKNHIKMKGRVRNTYCFERCLQDIENNI